MKYEVEIRLRVEDKLFEKKFTGTFCRDDAGFDGLSVIMQQMAGRVAGLAEKDAYSGFFEGEPAERMETGEPPE